MSYDSLINLAWIVVSIVVSFFTFESKRQFNIRRKKKLITQIYRLSSLRVKRERNETWISNFLTLVYFILFVLAISILSSTKLYTYDFIAFIALPFVVFFFPIFVIRCSIKSSSRTNYIDHILQGKGHLNCRSLWIASLLSASSKAVILNSVLLILLIVVAASQLNIVNDLKLSGTGLAALVFPVIAAYWVSEYVSPFSKWSIVRRVVSNHVVRIAVNTGKDKFPVSDQSIGIIVDVSNVLRVQWSLIGSAFFEDIPWHNIARFALSVENDTSGSK
ncbi:MAG: hypothetical protein JRN15_14955 [Nitrososphaerota archaeon]|nr:hypothetical protein [Nitrososphaerota archaeon]